MLLNLMRKHAKSWLIKFLVGIIAAVFIFYFGYSFKTGSGEGKVATVNGEIITGLDYQRTYRGMLESLQREYKSVWNENLVKLFNVKGRALEALINQKLISQEAKRIGFDVTEKEVQEQILSYPAFQARGRFDESRYRYLLQNNHMKPEDFEAGLERELLQRKIQQFIGTFVTVTDADALEYYTYTNEKVKVGFLRFSPDEYKNDVKTTDEGIDKYFQENKERYRIPEKIKVAYVPFDPEKLKEKDRVGDREIQEYYEDNPALFKEEKEVKLRQILFNLPEGASEAEDKAVQEKAQSVLQKAKDGEDFAALAGKHSDDPSTKKNGGDLGYMKSGDMVKPVEEAAFKLKKGEVSDLVKSPFGYHILKADEVKEARTKTLDEAREKIKTTLEGRAAFDLAYDRALSFQDRMPHQADLRQFASENKMEVRESGYFSMDEPVPEVGGDPKLMQSIFSLGQGDVSEVLDVQGKLYLFQITDRKPSALPELTEVKDQVKEDLASKLAAVEAKSAAEKVLAKLKTGADWAAVAKEGRLAPATTELFSRQSPATDLGYDQELLEAAFGLSQKKVYPDKVFENDKGVFVIRYEGSESIDNTKFEEEKDRYRKSLSQARQQILLQKWLEGLRAKAEVKILLRPEKEGMEF
jgi:peptidyl-prolyl cis-trans isomerase D